MPGRYILALDEGSSSARAVIFDDTGNPVSEASRTIDALFPHPGWVELRPEDLWNAPRECIAEAMHVANLTATDIAAVGVTTHRETIVMWDRATGKPVHNAIMWMSKQTDDIIREWSQRGLDDEFRQRTGVRNDSYFSAGKIAWLLRNVPGVRERAERGELAIGTPDVWMLWNLTGGTAHRIEPSAASRTALLNVHRAEWDADLCAMLDIPLGLLPELVSSDAHFGDVGPDVLPGRSSTPVPVTAILGDQMAGLFGQACLDAGSTKNTFGTAGVLTANVGGAPAIMDGMSSSVAWKIGSDVTYEAEGVVFHSGQTIQWMRDKLHLVSSADEIEPLASRVADNGGVYVVPAFAGLCDPYWDRDVRAAIMGLTLATGAEHIARASIESLAYQTRDNVERLVAGGIDIPQLRVDGGATRNNLLCQFQSDILGIPVARPVGLERTVLGIAHLAGVRAGFWGVRDIADRWSLERLFEPVMSADQREALYEGWQNAVSAARSLPPALR
ncbi:MAG: glycerol kinase GlpK [Microbacteriaceae bacterium]|nr:glycerol kinase GlpK [Microbacteriaceae bacterium]